MIKVHTNKKIGCIKPMHAVNNGPSHKANDQVRSNLEAYKNAHIPFARNHDASYYAYYGGEHTVDVNFIFPDFDRDAEDPDAYDFCLTDEYLKLIESAGTKVFYRLGSKIEHWKKKYNTLPPKDFHKWAVICEHIIRHYNEGWADGFHMGIEYWEIWNEPDNSPDDGENKTCWGGTAKEFYEFFVVAATHLKNCFPHLKIGGPASVGLNYEWLDGFFSRLTQGGQRTPLDFFSWHLYHYEVGTIVDHANRARKLLDSYGYTQTESILDEWNYVRDWGKDFDESIQTIISMKGAAFTMACMLALQNTPLDLLMYYDARPCIFNGLFDFYSLRPIKGYYPFVFFNKLYECGDQLEVTGVPEDVYALSARNENSVETLICYYTDQTDKQPITVDLSIENAADYRYWLLDETESADKEHIVSEENGKIQLIMQPNTVCRIRCELN